MNQEEGDQILYDAFNRDPDWKMMGLQAKTEEELRIDRIIAADCDQPMDIPQPSLKDLESMDIYRNDSKPPKISFPGGYARVLAGGRIHKVPKELAEKAAAIMGFEVVPTKDGT